MKPRFAADYRLLFWMLFLLPALPLLSLSDPWLAPYLLPAAIYLAYCTGVASHNHNHCPVFSSRLVNAAYSAWLSAFYGYPIFAWVPTHNQNHHRFNNAEGDMTRTSRYAPHNTLWHAVTYPLASIVYQSPSISRYVLNAVRKRPAVGLGILAQYVTLLAVHVGYLIAAVHLHGLWSGTVVYALAMGIPSVFAIWSMMFTNFVQHVDCDPSSPHDHSRNFVGRGTNWLLFNAGYHTVHHERPGVHWSHYQRLHEARAAQIRPELNQPSIFAYCWSTYFAAPKHERRSPACG